MIRPHVTRIHGDWWMRTYEGRWRWRKYDSWHSAITAALHWCATGRGLVDGQRL